MLSTHNFFNMTKLVIVTCYWNLLVVIWWVELLCFEVCPEEEKKIFVNNINYLFNL